ncbi:uncharacterized protein LOC126988992 [Eriocheir sinensis]|uniref:uncharacterized protein LOC126988992 n=1 Tax=Eriocheir sinensis TaxID=95602 RepID=UPI0021C8D84C|nr:uncharacterized protein LOC126988992 [Eriocheir sinensis]
MASSTLEAAWGWLAAPGSLQQLAAVDLGIQWALWAVAAVLRTEKFYDLAGSSTFILLAYLNYRHHGRGHPRQAIQTGCVCLWALRLGLFLFTRVLRSGGDRRFRTAVEEPFRLFVFWTMQGLWVFFTLLPSLMGVNATRQPPLGMRDYAGWSLWAVGFLVEVVADYQKTVFRRDAANEGKFISSGLWSVSRHPNYFGEILLWFGLYLSASASFRGWQHLAVICPVLDYLLIAKVSGVPFLERYAAKKWGALPQYREYVASTPLLVPFMG